MSTSLRELELAIAHGDTHEVGVLLEAEPGLIGGRFADNIGLTPLMWACRNRHTTIVELLLRKGADVHAVNFVEPNGDGGNPALWFTAQGAAGGNVPIARMLLDHGAAINQAGEHGTTPFFMAVLWVHMELVQFLLSRGADPVQANGAGISPLEAVRRHYDGWQKQEGKTEEMKRFEYRAPRMIAFLEQLTGEVR